MPDCLAAELLAEMGTVIGRITAANGYTQTLSSANIVYDAVDLVHENLPAAEILLTDLSYEEVDNESQQVQASFRILGYVAQTTEDDATLATKKVLLEFGADFRTTILSMYTRQQAGTFTMDEFEIVGPINQVFAADKNLGMVLTEFSCQFMADRTAR